MPTHLLAVQKLSQPSTNSQEENTLAHTTQMTKMAEYHPHSSVQKLQVRIYFPTSCFKFPPGIILSTPQACFSMPKFKRSIICCVMMKLALDTTQNEHQFIRRDPEVACFAAFQLTSLTTFFWPPAHLAEATCTD